MTKTKPKYDQDVDILTTNEANAGANWSAKINELTDESTQNCGMSQFKR